MIDKKISNFANHLADLSEVIAKKYFRLPNGESIKEDKSPVTLADQEIEEVLRSAIIEHFPEHGIIGEEYGMYNEDADYQWIIDPIDGTSSFIMGRPTFGTLIALAHKGKPILGIINQPISKERWLGIDAQGDFGGAWLNGKAIKTRQCDTISNALISTTSQFYFAKNDFQKFQTIAAQAKYQKFGGVVYGSDCYAYGLLAAGFVDIIIEPGLQVYDYAAIIPIIKMAGGVVSDWQGNDLELKSNVKVLACGSKEIHEEVMRMLK